MTLLLLSIIGMIAISMLSAYAVGHHPVKQMANKMQRLESALSRSRQIELQLHQEVMQLRHRLQARQDASQEQMVLDVKSPV